MKSKQDTKVDAFKKEFKSNVQLRTMLAELRKKKGNATLGFAPIGDMHVPNEMHAEIERRVSMEAERGSIRSIGVVCRQCLFNTIAPASIIDLGAVRKEGNRLKKDFPDAIFRIVFFPTLIGHDLGFGATIAAMVLSGDPAASPRLQPATGVLPATLWKANPSPTEIAEVVAAFQSAQLAIRRLSGVAARHKDAERWSALRDQALVQCRLIDLLTPAKRMFDASGSGVEILKHALTGPEARAKRLGKSGISREELTHQLWNHALVHGRIAPPFVKL